MSEAKYLEKPKVCGSLATTGKENGFRGRLINENCHDSAAAAAAAASPLGRRNSAGL